MTTTFSPCECPESRLLREWLTDPWSPPDAGLWPMLETLAEHLAVNRLRRMSHDLAVAADWSAASRRPSRAERSHTAPAGQLWQRFRDRHGGEYRGGPVDWRTGRPRVAEARAALVESGWSA